jgi:hypothetical protein
MNIPRNFAVFLIAILAASPLQAGCIDRAFSSFVENANIVEICEKAVCLTASQDRSCGNMHYSSQRYELVSEIWLFRIRMNDPEAGNPKEFAIEARPSDPSRIPLTIVDSRPMRLLVGTQIEPVRTRQLSCVPVSDTDACDFINAVLSGPN